MKSIRLGTGLAYWGDTLEPSRAMVERADIDYLCCDHLAELTMSMLANRRSRNPSQGYTPDVIDLLRPIMSRCRERGIKVVTDAGGANPEACGAAIVELCRRLGLDGLKVAVVTGDDIMERIDGYMADGITFENLDTGASFSEVREQLTHANVYTGCEAIVEALERGADIVVCGRVTDIALYLGPMRYELGWGETDWELLGAGAGAAHIIECGGQATGGIYAGGWATVPDLEHIGYPIAEVSQDGTAVITKTPDSGGEVSIGTLSEQLVYEIHDPATYLTADVTADLSSVRLEQVGPDRVAVTGITGRRRPDTLKVNIGYRAGYIGETQFTYTWPNAYDKAKAGIAFLERRLEMAGFRPEATRVEYLGQNSMWGPVTEPDYSPDVDEVVIRYAARTSDAREARKVFTESVSLYNNGPAGAAALGTRKPPQELFAAWPALIPRDLVRSTVEILEV